MVELIEDTWRALHAGLTREHDVDETTIRWAIEDHIKREHPHAWNRHHASAWRDVMTYVVPTGDYGRGDGPRD